MWVLPQLGAAVGTVWRSGVSEASMSAGADCSAAIGFGYDARAPAIQAGLRGEPHAVGAYRECNTMSTAHPVPCWDVLWTPVVEERTLLCRCLPLSSQWNSGQASR